MLGQFQLCCSAPSPQARHVCCLHSGIHTSATGRRRRCSAASGLLADRAQTARGSNTDTPAAAAAEAAAASTRQGSTSRASQPHRLYACEALYQEQPMLLTAHIKKCADWQHLRQLLQRAGTAVNHIHLSAAATHCAQRQQQELGGDECAAWMLALVQQLLVQHSESVQPRQLANTLWGVAKCCQQVPQELLEQLLLLQQQQMEQQLQQAPQQQQQQQQQQHGRQPQATGTGSCWHKPQDLSHSLWALATLQHQPTLAWQASFWELSGQLLPGFSLQQLSNSVWAAARLQLQVPQPWLQQLLAAAAAHMQQLAADSATPHQQLPAAERLTPRGGSSSSRSSSVESETAAGQAHSLALIAHGLARLGCRPDAAWLAAFYSASRPLLPAASPGQLSMLLWSLAAWQAGPVPSDWLQAFAASLQPQLPAALNQGIVNTAASCYQLLLALRSSRGKQPQQQQQQQQQQQVQELQQLLAAVLAEAANHVDGLAVNDAAALAWAAAGLSCWDVGGSPSAAAGAAAACDSLKQLEQQQLGWLHSFVALHTSSAAGAVQQADGELLLLLWLCAKAGTLPSSMQWCAAACSAVTAQLEQASPGELARLSWTLGQLLKVPGTTQHTREQQHQQQGQPVHAVQPPVANSISSDDEPARLQVAELAGPLLSLAAQLLQRMPRAMPAMSQQELLESVAGAASIAGAQAAHSEQQQLECEGRAANLALLVEAAASAACGHVSTMSGTQLLLLARSLLQLLQHKQAAAGGKPNSRERLRQPLLQLLRAASEQLSALPPAAAVSCGLSFLAVGVAASAPKPTEAAGSQPRPLLPAAASFTDAAAGSSLPAATEARGHHGPNLLRVSSSRPLLGFQSLQERLLAVVAGSVHRLNPAELLAATQLTQRLRLALPGSATAELLYALQLQVSRAAFTPEQLLALLVLLQHWRGVPRSAAAARASLVGGWLRATHRLMQQQLQQLQSQDGSADAALVLAASSPAGKTGDGDTAAAAVPALLAGFALGLARLHLQPPEPWLGCYCRLLQQALRLGLASSDDLSRGLLGLAGLSFRPDDQTVAVLLAVSATQLPGMSRSELVRVIHSLGKLGIAPGEAWLQSFYERVATAPGSFGLSGFGMLVWALARLGAAPPQAWLQQLLDSSFDTAGRASQQQGGQRMRRLRPQHMANIICAFAKLRFSPGERWLAWFRAELGQAAGPGGLLELDHFHIEWAWRELHEQYQAAAAGSSNEAGQTAAAGSSAGPGG